MASSMASSLKTPSHSHLKVPSPKIAFNFLGHIALGWVIVIALVISLFLIFLLVIGGIIAARIRRAREGYMPAPGTPPISETSLDRLPPDRLIGNLEDRRQGGFL